MGRRDVIERNIKTRQRVASRRRSPRWRVGLIWPVCITTVNRFSRAEPIGVLIAIGDSSTVLAGHNQVEGDDRHPGGGPLAVTGTSRAFGHASLLTISQGSKFRLVQRQV